VLAVTGTAGNDVVNFDTRFLSGPATISWADSVNRVSFDGAGGNDTVNVGGGSTSTPLDLAGGAGDDAFTFGDDSFGLFGITQLTSIRGDAGTDSLYLNDTADDHGWGYYLMPTGFHRVFIGDVTFATLESVRLDTGTGNDGLIVTPSADATFNVNGGAPAGAATVYEGDTFTLGFAGATGVTRTNGPAAGTGQYAFANRRPINFTGVEWFDETRPAVTSAEVRPDAFPTSLDVTFNDSVGASLAASDLVVTNLTTGQPRPPSRVSWGGNPTEATFEFAGAFEPGRYRATLPADAVADVAGNGMAADFVYEWTIAGPPPQVNAVLVSSSAWAPTFR
jgi:hypothetical protein